MPDYIVLRCFSCQLFQCHQQRADKKFRCVVCGERQSHRHVYAVSNRAADLRQFVQDLNMKHGKLQEERKHQSLEAIDVSIGADVDDDSHLANSHDDVDFRTASTISTGSGRWAQFASEHHDQVAISNADASTALFESILTSIRQPSTQSESNASSHSFISNKDSGEQPVGSHSPTSKRRKTDVALSFSSFTAASVQSNSISNSVKHSFLQSKVAPAASVSDTSSSAMTKAVVADSPLETPGQPVATPKYQPHSEDLSELDC